MSLARLKRRAPLSAALCALLTAALVPAQTQSTKQTQSTNQTQNPSPAAAPSPSPAAVRLGFVVTDANGRAVGDLRREDFRVFEDGAEQTVTQFGRESGPLSYALVLDNSGSLRTQIPLVIDAAGALVAANEADDETAVIRFVAANNIRLLQDFTSEARRLQSALDELYAEGGQTAVLDAVYVAVQHLEKRRPGEEGRRRAVVLVTDGEERGSTVRRDELVTLLRRNDVRVFAVGLVDLLNNAGSLLGKSAREKSVELLNRLAAETGGRAFFPRNAAELRGVVGELSAALRAPQYVVGYTPTNAAQDGSYRKVRVTVADAPGRGKLTAHARAGYKAPGRGEKEKQKN